jgi:hypothetical protein
MAVISSVLRFKKSAEIYREGDDASAVFNIISGVVNFLYRCPTAGLGVQARLPTMTSPNGPAVRRWPPSSCLLAPEAAGCLCVAGTGAEAPSERVVINPPLLSTDSDTTTWIDPERTIISRIWSGSRWRSAHDSFVLSNRTIPVA